MVSRARRRARLALVAAAAVALVTVGGWSWAGVPDTSGVQPSIVYFSDGTTEMGRFHRWDAEFVTLEDLPAHVTGAVVAAADPDFFDRSIDGVTTLKAVADLVRGHEVTLGDPVTEAYVRQFSTGETAVTAARNLARTLREETTRTRTEILERSLNTAYFGRGSYGIENAARAYFGVGAADLTTAQAEMLGVALTHPGTLPSDGPGIIPDDHADGWAADTGFLLDMVRAELASHGFSSRDLESDGLTIVTSFDVRAQRAAVNAVARLPEDRSPNTKVSVVSIDPSTGAVRALYGGEDYSVTTRNRPLLDRAQGGSTFKPFALIAALESGRGLNSLFPSASPIDVDGYVVTNVDHRDHGIVDLEYATANSVNAVYAQLNASVGPENTRDVAVRAGLPETTPGLDADPSNVFGTASPHPVDMATVFATYAAGGVRHERFVVEAVHDGSGRLLHEGGEPGERVFAAEVIEDATRAMAGVVAYGTGVEAALPGRPAAGKTGTSEENKSAWFCGFVPQLATVVAMYQIGDDGSEETITPFGGAPVVMGGSHPAAVWRDVMTTATRGMEVAPLPGAEVTR